MAQVIEHLTNNCKALDSIISTTNKTKQRMEATFLKDHSANGK
jgi:hypothetical protein